MPFKTKGLDGPEYGFVRCTASYSNSWVLADPSQLLNDVASESADVWPNAGLAGLCEISEYLFLRWLALFSQCRPKATRAQTAADVYPHRIGLDLHPFVFEPAIVVE